MIALHRPIRALLHNSSGVAMIEFAYSLPVVLLLSLVGAELTNYITVKMRMSQVALQIADNAARMGSGTATQAKMVTETDINDLFVGAQLESNKLDLRSNGRVILSDLETQTTGAATYRIRWQRCFGNQAHASGYGSAGDQNLTGMGPAGRQVTAQDSTPTMFVELYYVYKPLLKLSWAPTPTLTEIASMAVRDRRDTTGGTNGIYNTAGAPVSGC